MAPYLLTAIALAIAGIVAWLWEWGNARGEPARILLAWMALSAATVAIAAAGMWMGDDPVGRYLAAAARMYSMIMAAMLFLFARSFGAPLGCGVFFWSVPLQLGMAATIIGGGEMFALSGGYWILDMGNGAAVITALVLWFYGLLALAYAGGLYLALRREGREKEKRRTLALIAAIAVVFAASALRGTASGAAGSAICAAYLAHLGGVLLLAWAFRAPAMSRSAQR